MDRDMAYSIRWRKPMNMTPRNNIMAARAFKRWTGSSPGMMRAAKSDDDQTTVL